MTNDTHSSKYNYDKPERLNPDISSDQIQYSDKDYRVGFGRRLGAYFIDLIFMYIIMTFVVLSSIDVSTISGFEGWDLASYQSFVEEFSEKFALILALVVSLYFISELFLGVSLGKLLLKIKIADENRTQSSIKKLALRYFLKHISSIISIIAILTTLGFLDYIGSIFNFVIFIGCFFVLGANKLALHDMIAGTAVYYKDEIRLENN